MQGSDLTYRAGGGSGLFNIGILDTHFSERDREARLALLTAYTGTRFGFGVDEATALMVNTTEEEVQMEGLVRRADEFGRFLEAISFSQASIFLFPNLKHHLSNPA